MGTSPQEEDLLRFESALAECHNPELIRHSYESEGMCQICQFRVKDMRKHKKSFSHRRRESCLKLSVLHRDLNDTPNLEVLIKIRDILQIKTSEEYYLLSVHPRNWSDIIKSGPEQHRRMLLKDGSKLWFMKFWFDLQRTCQSLESTAMSAIAKDVDETISDLHLRKLDPLKKVVLTSQLNSGASPTKLIAKLIETHT